jgi:hypothetical protein
MSIRAGTTTVTAAGTAVQVTAQGWNIKAVTFKTKQSNAGSAYIGDSNVSSSAGFELTPGSAHEFVFPTQGKLSWFYVDADNNNDKVDWFVMSI